MDLAKLVCASSSFFALNVAAFGICPPMETSLPIGPLGFGRFVAVVSVLLGLQVGVAYAAARFNVLASASLIAPRACFAIVSGWRCFHPGEYFKKRKSWRRIINQDGGKSESKAGIWYMDTASQCHATGDLRLFCGHLNMTAPESWVSGVSGQVLPIHGFGTVQFACFMLEEVYYVPGLTRNLISISKFLKKFSGYGISFGEAGCYIKEEATGKRICELRSVEGLYELDSVLVALDRTPAAP